MDLLASVTLNFDPTVSTTENRSFGVLAKWRRDFPKMMRARLIIGTDVDYSPGARQEDSLNVTTSGADPPASSAPTAPHDACMTMTLHLRESLRSREISPSSGCELAVVCASTIPAMNSTIIWLAPILVPVGALPRSASTARLTAPT